MNMKHSNRTVNIIECTCMSQLHFMYTSFRLTVDTTEPVPIGSNTDGIYTTYPQHVKPGTVASQVFMHVHHF